MKYNTLAMAALVFISCTGTAKAQVKNFDSIPARFTRYQADALQEKLFVHTDKTFYLAGETLWFKAYDVDALFHRPMPSSGIAYIEVTGQDQKPVLRTSVRIQEGSGNGSWIIPANIISGNYLLRAYTSWMKNFSPDFYFQQRLTIVNTVNASGIDMLPPTAYDLRFFPEGGHLVYGLETKVGFKGVDQDGNGVDCKGVILDQKKDTVARFRSARFGMGHFTFNPKKGERYTVLASVHDSLIGTKLPDIDAQGYSLHLEEADNDRLKITVHTTLELAGQPLYLFTHTRQLVKNFRAGYVSNGQAIFYIDRNVLGDGISQLTLFNGDRSPVCERLYFKMPAMTMGVEVKGLLPEYGTRKKIDLSLLTTSPSSSAPPPSAPSPAGSPVPGDLSMSVFLLDSLQSLPQENILTYLLLTSDLRGKIECPQCYFENPGAPASAEAVDNLMLTQGWTRFKWDEVLNDRSRPVFEFLPETNGPVINGKIVDKKTGRPVPSVVGYLSSPGRYFEFHTAISQPNGDIRFSAGDWTGNKELIVQTNSLTDSNYRVDIASPFSDRFPALSLPAFTLPQQWEGLLEKRSIDVQVENSYRIAEKHRFFPQDQDTLSFYGRPDKQYYLEDYTKFATLEEVMKEYVADVRLRKQSGKFYYRVMNSPVNLFFDDEPLLLLDGIPVFDADKLMKLDPAKMKKVEIVTHKYYVGPLINDGIIICRSTEGDLAGYSLDPDAVVLEYGSLQQQREFYTPVYGTKVRLESRLPDLRNQLQWSPAIHTTAGGTGALSFYTSDRVGKYAVVIQGMTRNGSVGATVLTFTVAK